MNVWNVHTKTAQTTTEICVAYSNCRKRESKTLQLPQKSITMTTAPTDRHLIILFEYELLM